MAHYHWKELFPPHIWQRGLDYYHNGHILNLRYRGNIITAEIEGTEIYTVSVRLDAGTNRIEYHSCDCPYGEDGTPCKHLAALLCALDDDAINDASKDEKELTKEQVVNLLSEQQMRSLLVQFARNDSYIWEKIQLAATKQLPQMQKRQWELDLQELTDSAEDRYGYINYEEAYDYCISLQEYLDERIPDLLDVGLTGDAFELSCQVFQTAMEQDMDDSDGGLSFVAGSCMDAWTSILGLADLDAHREMFQWFVAHYYDHEVAQIFLDDYIFDAPWKNELIPEVLQFLDQQLHESLEAPNGGYRLENLIIYRIRLMKLSGASSQNIDEYISKYRLLPVVREMQISQAMHDSDFEAALALLEESKVLDKDKAGLVAKYSTQKIKIYELTNNVSALRDELEYYLFTFRQDDLTYAEKMKALLPPTEWEEMRARLLDSISMRSQVYQFLKNEDMYEQLMERIEKNSDIYALERYEPLLKKNYAQRCINLYIAHLQPAMGRASNRKAYWSVIQTLKKLRKYPNGNAVAQSLADNWKQEYPRRSSMLDELRKAGY